MQQFFNFCILRVERQRQEMDSKDFKERFMAFYPKLYRIAYRIVDDAAEAEDVVQEVYAKLWHDRNSLYDVKNPEAYCTTVLKNAALQHIRNRHNTDFLSIDDGFERVTDETYQPAETLESREKLNDVIKIMEHLPPQQREVLRLRAISGLSMQDIEKATGLSDSNIRSLLSRARKRLKDTYNKLTK